MAAVLTGPAGAALALATGAADAAELRTWLQMTGLLADAPIPAGGRPAWKAEKRCPRCATVKPASEWHRNKRHADGLATYCKTCAAAYVRDHTPIEERRENKRAQYRNSREGKPDLRLKENRPLRAGQRSRHAMYLRLTPELAARIGADAEVNGIPMTAVARDILTSHYAITPAARKDAA